ncbi:MAG: histidinol dehydrogenase [Candidatus Omnitrophota bacterium]|nr:MAG: histidinol dehydrogenase [Candidatus Omnitrophota bacterium]
MEIIEYSKDNLKRISSLLTYKVEEKVRRLVSKVIRDVRQNGDKGILKWTKEFDKIDLSLKRIKVSEGDVNRAYQRIDCSFIPLLRSVINNVEEFYRKEKKRELRIRRDGVVLGRLERPIERVGVYIPGGSAALISTVYMSVIPAKVAGVKEIILTSPVRERGEIDAHILVVANLLGVKEIYRIGGAQAIAALAFGTSLVKKVDKIVGPGNVYVQEAKRQCFGFVDIDMLAGPSEVVIVADDSTPVSFVIADLHAQQEHKEGSGILLTNSSKLAEVVQKEINKGWIILLRRLEEAVEVINLLAPEHLQLMVSRARDLIPLINNAGAIFVGRYSPVAVGDYFAGPSHILPTQGGARFFSCLRRETFVKASHYISCSRKGLEKAREVINKLSEIEGMIRHKESIEIRFRKSRNGDKKSGDSPQE